MKILMHAPTFSDKEDENYFFEWVHKLPGYKNVQQLGSHLLLGFNAEMKADTVIQLHAIFERWGINKSPLEALQQYVMNPEKFQQETSQ